MNKSDMLQLSFLQYDEVEEHYMHVIGDERLTKALNSSYIEETSSLFNIAAVLSLCIWTSPTKDVGHPLRSNSGNMCNL